LNRNPYGSLQTEPPLVPVVPLNDPASLARLCQVARDQLALRACLFTLFGGLIGLMWVSIEMVPATLLLSVPTVWGEVALYRIVDRLFDRFTAVVYLILVWASLFGLLVVCRQRRGHH